MRNSPKSRSAKATMRAEILDQAHFFFHRHSDHQTRFIAEFAGRLDVARFRRAITELKQRNEILCYRYDEDRKGARWTYPSDSSACDCLTEETPEPQGFEATLRERIHETTAPQQGNSLTMRILHGARDDTLVLIVDHTLTDGAGLKHLTSELFSLYAGRTLAPPTSQNRNLAAALHSLTWSQRLSMLRPPQGPQWRRPFNFAWSKSGPVEPRFHFSEIEPERFSALKQYAQTRRATINDLLLTATFRALHHELHTVSEQTLERGELAVDVPVDLRRHLSFAMSVGIANFATPIRCWLREGIGTNFEHTLALVSGEMNRAKCAQAELCVAVLLVAMQSVVPYRFLRRLLSAPTGPFAPLLTNVGLLDPKPLEAAQVRSARMTGALSRYGPLSILACTDRSRLQLAAGAYCQTQDHERISRIMAGLVAELRQCV